MRGPRRFNRICGTCSEREHLSRHCILRRDRIYSDVPTLSSHRRSTVAAAAAPATIYQCRPRYTAVTAAAPAVTSRGPRHSTAAATTATVPTGVHSSSTDATPMVARGTVRHLYNSTAAVVIVIVRNCSCDTTVAATVGHCGRSSTKAPSPSVDLSGSRGALAAMNRRRIMDWRIALRRGKRSRMLAWTTKMRENGLQRR